jgi:hypothetical protein
MSAASWDRRSSKESSKFAASSPGNVGDVDRPAKVLDGVEDAVLTAYFFCPVEFDLV